VRRILDLENGERFFNLDKHIKSEETPLPEFYINPITQTWFFIDIIVILTAISVSIVSLILCYFMRGKRA